MGTFWSKLKGRAAAPISRVTAELAPNGRIRGSTFASGYEGDSFEIRGWLLHPTLPIDRVKVSVNGAPVGTVPIVKRANVEKAHALIPHAVDSGYEARRAAPPSGVLRVTAEGSFRDSPVGVSQTYHMAGRDAERFFPPAELMKRVAGTENPPEFAYIGINLAMDLMNTADKHMGLGNVKTLLDYGCGSGRVSHFLMKLFPQIQLSGCDIDAEAIAWDNEHLAPGRFKAMAIAPPLPYPDDSFDAAVAVSVMTHLELAEQHKWLAEVQRVLKPGGVFLASFNGAFSAHFVAGMAAQLERSPITDQTMDEALAGVAPAGYYRSTFQLPSFTEKEWARHFEVVEIIQAGCGAVQDLAVLRKR